MGDFQHRGPLRRREAGQPGGVESHLIGGELTCQAALIGIELVGLPAQGGFQRRAKKRCFHQARHVGQCADRVRRDGVPGILLGQAQLRTGDLEQAEQLIGAVLGQKVIVETYAVHLPEMIDQPLSLGAVQVERIGPDIAVFDPGVLLDLLVVGKQPEDAGVAAGQPLPCKPEALGVIARGRREVHRIRQQLRAARGARRIDAQQRVAEHGRRAVRKRGRENQADAIRAERGPPPAISVALRPAKRVRRQPQRVDQKLAARDKDTVRRLVAALDPTAARQRLEGGVEFGRRIGTPRGREKEAVAGHRTVQPLAQPVGLVMQQRSPARTVGEPAFGGARLQRRHIRHLRVFGLRHAHHGQPEKTCNTRPSHHQVGPNRRNAGRTRYNRPRPRPASSHGCIHRAARCPAIPAHSR